MGFDRIVCESCGMTLPYCRCLKTWGYSRDGETYTGAFASRDEALGAGADYARYVGQFRDPICEEAIDAEDVLEKILRHDDYRGDWAKGSLIATDEQRAELTGRLRAVVGEWLDRHGLRPAFGVVASYEEIKKEPTP